MKYNFIALLRALDIDFRYMKPNIYNELACELDDIFNGFSFNLSEIEKQYKKNNNTEKITINLNKHDISNSYHFKNQEEENLNYYLEINKRIDNYNFFVSLKLLPGDNKNNNDFKSTTTISFNDCKLQILKQNKLKKYLTVENTVYSSPNLPLETTHDVMFYDEKSLSFLKSKIDFPIESLDFIDKSTSLGMIPDSFRKFKIKTINGKVGSLSDYTINQGEVFNSSFKINIRIHRTVAPIIKAYAENIKLQKLEADENELALKKN